MSDEARAGHIARTPLGRVGTPADIASVAVFLASDDAGLQGGARRRPAVRFRLYQRRRCRRRRHRRTNRLQGRGPTAGRPSRIRRRVDAQGPRDRARRGAAALSLGSMLGLPFAALPEPNLVILPIDDAPPRLAWHFAGVAKAPSASTVGEPEPRPELADACCDQGSSPIAPSFDYFIAADDGHLLYHFSNHGHADIPTTPPTATTSAPGTGRWARASGATALRCATWKTPRRSESGGAPAQQAAGCRSTAIPAT